MKLASAALLLLVYLPGRAQLIPRYGVLIHEIFADPTPVIGLPAAEFIELRNRTPQTIDLKGWTIGDESHNVRIPASILLKPDSFLILCPASAAADYSMWGKTVGLSGFPSLNNDGDLLILSAPDGRIIHALYYSSSWHQNALKAQGGWSLEMRDPEHPCSGAANWTSSTHAGGGSPGKENAVHAPIRDTTGPRLQQVIAIDSSSLELYFDKPVDSASAAQVQHYSLAPKIERVAAMALPPLFQKVVVTLGSPLQRKQVYELTATNIRDCRGQGWPGPQVALTGLPERPEAGALVLNEILFNPRPGVSDYVELYHRGKTIIDLRQLYVANRTQTGTLSHSEQVAKVPACLFPGEYLVLTEDPVALSWNYTVSDMRSVRELHPLPSLPDDRGTLVLLWQDGMVIDELHYDHLWHFALLDQEEGVALERIDPAAPTQEKNNWCSASAVSGFGTPGRRNSQFHTLSPGKNGVRLDPVVFSPDNDGFNDRLGIHYALEEPGFLAHISIYDGQGYALGEPFPLKTLDQQGVLWWDGLDRNRQALPSGSYLLLVELIHPRGKIFRYKLVATLARKR